MRVTTALSRLFSRYVRGTGDYLPDPGDHGPEGTEFVDFFATYKATLPAIGRLMKVCRARMIPLFPVYDGKTHRLSIEVRPPMDDLLSG